MIQAIRLLALPLQELSEQIRQELEENPALELLTDNAELSLDVMEDSLDTFRDSDETLREAEYSDEAFGFNNDENDRTAIIEQTIATEESLQEHLSGQLGLLPLNDAERQVAERLIQNTDENGFHILPPQEICPDCEPGTLERILSLLQRLDPPGTCTSGYRESLIVQAQIAANAPRKTIEVLTSHFEDLQTRNRSAIKKSLGLNDRELDHIIDFIRTLDPFPGRSFSRARPRYIVPGSCDVARRWRN
jgi:DNA-directed RNA polymerase specialized sigma subunit, sigma54 homolog